MNATDPAAPLQTSDETGLPSYALATRQAKLLQWLTLAVVACLMALAGLREAAAWLPSVAVLRQPGLLPVAGTSLLLAVTGLGGTWLMALARRRAVSPPAPPAAPSPRWRRAFRVRTETDPARVGRMARWPQAILVSGFTMAAMACAWLLRAPAAPLTVPPNVHFILAGVTIAFAFPLLIAERVFAAMPPVRLPEAPALRTLLLLPVLAWPAAGLAQIASGLGLPFAGLIDTAVLVILSAVAVELCLRALGRCFLPPPAPAQARAAIESILARMIAEGVQTRGLAAPIRNHLGIDFSRSWALAYIRAAIPAVVVLLLVLCWSLSGAVLVGLDQRAVYERFGAPVAVLRPGLHAILPWPMGQVRRTEFGTLHDLALSDAAASLQAALTGAEDLPPPDADRLWEQAHPAELMFLIASETGGKQSFQVVSADIRIRYRIGLTDRDALLAVYRVADPAALVRSAASRIVEGFFAGRTLDAVLGANREAVAGELRAALQHDLDLTGCGIDLTAVVIEAIHPPAGAAEAYHAVQAAEIMAVTSIAAERGKAIATRAEARQYGTDIVTKSSAAAAETMGLAAADATRFTAEFAAAAAGGESFLLERRLTALADSLATAPLTIIDHRIPASDAPMLDLRPFSAGAARTVEPGQE